MYRIATSHPAIEENVLPIDSLCLKWFSIMNTIFSTANTSVITLIGVMIFQFITWYITHTTLVVNY